MQLEGPASTQSPIGDKDRLSYKVLVVIEKACLWHMLPQSELVALKLTDVVNSRHLLSTIFEGVCRLANADKEFRDCQADKNAPKVGGVIAPAVPNPGKVASKLRGRLLRLQKPPLSQLCRRGIEYRRGHARPR